MPFRRYRVADGGAYVSKIFQLNPCTFRVAPACVPTSRSGVEVSELLARMCGAQYFNIRNMSERHSME